MTWTYRKVHRKCENVSPRTVSDSILFTREFEKNAKWPQYLEAGGEGAGGPLTQLLS